MQKHHFELLNMRIVQYSIKDMRNSQYEFLDMRLGEKASLGRAGASQIKSNPGGHVTALS